MSSVNGKLDRFVPRPVKAVLNATERWRDDRLADARHSDRVAAILGSLLGISFLVCFATGMLSHLIQHPPGWFVWPSRPAGLYRLTQGFHIATGIAAVPLLFAKLWSVFPRLFQWPLADNALHAVERLSLLPLIGGSIFMLVTGVANIELWYPWVFFFPAGHYSVSYVVIGSLLIHSVAKFATVRRELSPRSRPATAAGRVDAETAATATATATAIDRRRFLIGAGSVSAGLVVATVGQTVSPLRKLSLLAPRRPDIGVQGFPVNKTAHEAGVEAGIQNPGYTLVVQGRGIAPRTFTLDELRAMPQRTATLPIACVEGWSANRVWTGVSVRDVLESAGVRRVKQVSVESLQRQGRYRRSILNSSQYDDIDTLLALKVDGEQLHVDHGFPLRLIAPNRPGVLQTKWVAKLVVS